MIINKKGFTLIEILVAVLILGVLATIAIPGYMRVIEKNRAAGAIQTLSEIAKAENDYYTSQSMYTNDFSDLVLTMTDENTMADADHSSYRTSFFVYNLINSGGLATASRNKGEDSYTLYRFYADPTIYCRPEENKYCKALELPAGTFTYSVGMWQSCPGGHYPCSMDCARNATSGYSCYGTYNADGTFTERVCDSNNACTTTQYNDKNTPISSTLCRAYNAKGVCTNGIVSLYDNLGRPITSATCIKWNSDNTCNTYKTTNPGQTAGMVYTYDQYENISKYIICTSWNNDGTCATYSGANIKNYDANGNLISTSQCTVDTITGECTSYRTNFGLEYSYDANGNLLRSAYCANYNSNGTCATLSNGSVYTYDTNGNQTSQRYCSSFNSDGVTCNTYSSGGYVYQYDENGRMISKAQCGRFNNAGTCVDPYTWGSQVYLYDESGQKTGYAQCGRFNSNGSCASYGTSGYLYTYDANGNQIGQRSCSSWNSNGTCAAVGSGTVYTYDANGNQISSRSCSSFNNDGSCAVYGSSGNIYTYDEHGNKISYSSCQLDSEGNCIKYTRHNCYSMLGTYQC